MSIASLQASLATAGSDYATKLAALRTAYVEVAALERALCNNDVGGAQSIDSFGPVFDPLCFRHPQYTPTFGGSVADDISARTAAILAAYTP